MAMWELAPGSPWNAIFILLMDGPCNSGSGFGKQSAGSFEIGRGVDAAGDAVNDHDVDAHPGFDRPQLLQVFLHLQGRARQRHISFQRRAPVRIEADMMVT